MGKLGASCSCYRGSGGATEEEEGGGHSYFIMKDRG